MSLKKTRVRRTNQEIDDTLFRAAEELISEQGFSNLTMKSIYSRANIEHAVFYKRYKDLNDFLEKFVRNFDYWLNDSMKFDPKKGSTENLEEILSSLVDSMINSPCMQKLLVWEMTEKNYITERTAQNRDQNCNQFIRFFIDEYDDYDVDYRYVCSLIIGGIYYLVLHRNMGTINFIDFSKKESMEKLKITIRLIINKLFGETKPSDNTNKAVKKEAIRIAEDLIRNNIDYTVIKQATKLDDKLLISLYERSGKAK